MRRDYQKLAAKLSTERDALRFSLNGERGRLVESQGRVATLTEARSIAQEVAVQIQEEAHKKIASLVTRCLEAVFDHPYSFHIHFERIRGKTEARLVFERGGVELEGLDSVGGGVIDVAAFALRLACLSLTRPRPRMALFLDEPFRFVSANYRPRVAELLETLSQELSLQVLLVTHDADFRLGSVVHVGG
jgi:DNA repair exonuclease SbcCD ATPase subunit